MGMSPSILRTSKVGNPFRVLDVDVAFHLGFSSLRMYPAEIETTRRSNSITINHENMFGIEENRRKRKMAVI